MPEVILPGTYITVRDEGLITAGRIATGYIGVVGTAERGPYNQAVIVGSLSEAREVFGDSGSWRGGGQSELTLMRTLELMFNNGASTVYAVRAAPVGAAPAALPILKGEKQRLAEFRSRSLGAPAPGTEIRVKISDAAEAPGAKQLQVSRVAETYTAESFQDLAAKLNRESALVLAELPDEPADGLPDNVEAQLAGGTPVVALKKGTVEALTLKPKVRLGGSEGLQVKVGAVRGDKDRKQVQLVRQETYLGSSYTALAADVNTVSTLVLADIDPASADAVPADVDEALKGGSDGGPAADYKRALEVLEREIVNIVVLAGQTDAQASLLQGHLNRTAQIQRERIGIIGSNGSGDVAKVAAVTEGVASERLIFVAPGIKARQLDPATGEEREVDLPGAYTAAAVAGLISSLPVHVSPTNKTLAINGLSTTYTSSQLEKLVQSRVLAVEKREGYRVVKGITTATNSAWHQVTTRRIVDYALYGIRSACNPYVGKLNNSRVRSAMKATLDAFLTRMVEDEALVGYQLDVSASRAQEIAGECMVTMTIQPTFSIDFIKVTMYLS